MTTLAVHRWLPEGVSPIELWDLPVGGELLYARLGSEQVTRLRSRGVAESEIDRRLGDALGEALLLLEQKRGRGLGEVVASGGLSRRPGLLEAAARVSGLAIELDPDVTANAPLIIELGQTRLKLTCASHRLVVPRPLELLPIHRTEDGRPAAQVAREQGARLLVHVASVVLGFLRAQAIALGPEVILALPCAIDFEGPLPSPLPQGGRGDALGPCTYAGLGSGWPMALMRRVAASLSPEPSLAVRLINDAELAAFRAQQRRPAAEGLAITLGFGPGAAWFRSVR